MRNAVEKETIIVFNEAEKSATIHTYNRKIIKYLMEIKDVEQDMEFISENQGDHKFEVPKSWVHIRAKKKMHFTEEQIEQKRKQMQALRLKRKSK